MKRKTTLIALLAGAVISAGVLTVKANPSLDVAYTSTEVGVPGSTLAGGTIAPANFTISSEVTYLGFGIYHYEYILPDVSNDPLLTFDVKFATAGENIFGVSNGGMVTPFEVNWSQYDRSGAPITLSFDSTMMPGFGGPADAADNGEWVDTSVIIPDTPPGATMPDGGLTISLLGGSLIGLQALRRKMAR